VTLEELRTAELWVIVDADGQVVEPLYDVTGGKDEVLTTLACLHPTRASAEAVIAERGWADCRPEPFPDREPTRSLTMLKGW
jgi:hypothetical protein